MLALQSGNLDYIDSTDYKTLGNRLEELKEILEDLSDKSVASRKLRYAEVDIEVEREAGRIAPDELYIPTHTIDTNIRREQSSYVQFVTQSMRAVICDDLDDPSVDLAPLEHDLTKKIRYEGWQLPEYANIDAFQANGYGIMELVYEEANPGSLGSESVQLGDFAFVADTRDIQSVEMCARQYYFTNTKLVKLCGDKDPNNKDNWNWIEVEKVTASDSIAGITDPGDSTDSKDKSLYRVQKVMFRVKGVVHVAWACIQVCDDWLRAPRPLYLGRWKLNDEVNKIAQTIGQVPPQQVEQAMPALQRLAPSITPKHIEQIQSGKPAADMQYETAYPYFLSPYLISENDTISHLKGRVFLDQDVQEGVTSLMSSLLTKTRRSAGLYFSKDVDDPNDDILLQKNVFLKQGALINKKVQAFELAAPDPGMFTAIQTLIAGNQNETSQVNFAENNRQGDSRKTAAAVKASVQMQQTLSTVQVVLYSLSLRQRYSTMCAIIKSRVLAGLLQVPQQIMPLYQRRWTVKPSGDVDVTEKAQLIQNMMQAWPVIQNTPAAQPFLMDLIEKMFPDSAYKYLKAFQQAQIQAQSQQAQQQQQMMQILQGMAGEITELSKHKDWFSEAGQINVYPKIQMAATQIKQMQAQAQAGKQPQQGQQ
jgi:hypothetical protein